MSNNTASEWGSRIGFILAGAGSAIGLGAIWKFPFWAGTYGGAAFILPYIFFTFTIGIALLIAELAIGRSGRGSALSALKKNGGPVFAVLGGLAVFTSYIILSYYSVVGGWIVKYLVDSVLGDLVTNDPKLLGDQFGALVSNGPVNIAWHFVFLSLTCGVVAMGVVHGIERLSKYLMPTFFILMIFIIIRALTLPGAWEGVKFLFALDFSAITLQGLLNAMGFTFFSLSLGCGIMVTYGAYLKSDTDIPNASLWIAYLAVQTAILAGLMILPAVFALGQDPG
ncbi:MAG: sodium-dependent transporter, partial [Duodenibacillus sp.]|nr:sodium-dependent transporter [Duodenibacillus sp.]